MYLRGNQVRVGDQGWRTGSMTGAGPGELLLTLDGHTQRWLVAVERSAAETTWLGRDGAAWAVSELTADRSRAAAAGGAELRSPMPGTVIAVQVALGDTVSAGQALLVVEAMKMEHGIRAPHAGVVSSLDVRVGQLVKVDALLATVDAAAEGTGRA